MGPETEPPLTNGINVKDSVNEDRQGLKLVRPGACSLSWDLSILSDPPHH